MLAASAAIAVESMYFKYDALDMGYLRMAPRVAVSWQLARQICQCQGAGWDLPVITSKEEQMFIEGRWAAREQGGGAGGGGGRGCLRCSVQCTRAQHVTLWAKVEGGCPAEPGGRWCCSSPSMLRSLCRASRPRS
jgi:hypothetical protein